MIQQFDWDWASPKTMLWGGTLGFYRGVSEIKSEPNREEGEEFLTRKETARLCRVKSLSTLWYWAKKGLLVPAMWAGRKPLYRRGDIMNFLERRGGVDNDR